jgi:hypothetical protein
MEDLKILLDGLLNMVTEIKERSEQQATKAEQILSALQSQSEQPAKPAGDGQTAARLKAVEQVVKGLPDKLASANKHQLDVLALFLQKLADATDEERGKEADRLRELMTTHHLELFATLNNFLERLPIEEPSNEEPRAWHIRLRQRLASYLKPKFFLLLSVVVVCAVSLATNFRLLHRNSNLRNSDLKYRYLLMKGEADGNTLERLEKTFNWERDENAVRQLRDTVIDYEYRLRKQTEALERARLLDEQAQKLKKEAEELK